MSTHDTLAQQRAAFKHMSSKTWEHPADRAALSALQNIPGVDVLLQKLIGVTSEKSLRLIFLASAVRVSSRQFPRLHALFTEACRILDAPYTPELYIAQSPFFNAGALGVERPFIVLHSALLDTLSEAETLTVIGHELGHCLSGHALYKTMLQILLKLSSVALQIPLGGAAILGILLALLEWNRKSELSADRAGLLVVQDPSVSYSLLMKMAGGSQSAQMDSQAFFDQAAEYEQGGNVLDSVHKLLNVLFVSHPFPVLRLQALKAWVDSGDYARVLAQHYTTRQEESRDDLFSHVKSASEAYRDDLWKSGDNLAEVAASLVESMGTLSNATMDRITSLFDFGKKMDQGPVRHSQERPAAAPSETAPPPATATASEAETCTPYSPQEAFAILEKLGELRDKGVITEEDFQAQKHKILQRL